MLFHRRAFKAAGLDGPEKLYKLKVPKGLRELSLELRDEVKNDFLFCKLDQTADGVCLDPSTALSTSALRYTLSRVGEITGFAACVTPYCFRYGAAKALNDSPLVSEQVQNVVMQHEKSKTMEKHYTVDIHVDLQGIWRGDGSQNSAVTREACSLRRTIDPRRPLRLTAEDLRHLAGQPTLQKLKRQKEKSHNKMRDLRHGPKDEYQRAHQKYEQARAKYWNEWRRARRKLLCEKRKTFLRDQPVRDVEHQLRACSPEGEVVGTFPDSPTLSPQHLALVEAVLQPPGETIEGDVNRLIAAVNAVRAYCGVMEGTVTRPTQRTHHGAGEKEEIVDEARLLNEAKAKVYVKSNKERSRICFLCLGDERKSIFSRVHEFSSPGALTKHFENIHLRRHPVGIIRCVLCKEDFSCRMALLNHAESRHGTVSRRKVAMCSGRPGCQCIAQDVCTRGIDETNETLT
ncbi:hypothetical protein VTN31DRAFT_4900 [Thermomyces dupontii]|uniref:uncharacterized protein n=1 Tax=Talaromyces thermophilus TaxID=28565 RepID=UPI003742562F